MTDSTVREDPGHWEAPEFSVTASTDGSLRFENTELPTPVLIAQTMATPALLLLGAAVLAFIEFTVLALLCVVLSVFLIIIGLAGLLIHKQHIKKHPPLRVLIARGHSQWWYTETQGSFFPFDKTTLTASHVKPHPKLPFIYTLILEYPGGKHTLVRTEDLKDFHQIMIRLKDMGLKTPAWETYTKGVAFYEHYQQAGGMYPAFLLKAKPFEEKDYR